MRIVSYIIKLRKRLLGYGVIPLLIAFGTNPEHTCYSYLYKQATIPTSGEANFGALHFGENLRIYSDIDSTDNILAVYTYKNIGNYPAGSWIRVKDDPNTAAVVIRDQYLEVRPRPTALRYVTVGWEDYTTQYPVFTVNISYNLYPKTAGARTIHRFKLLGTDPGNANPSIRVFGPDGVSVVGDIERVGRVIYVREEDTGDVWEPWIDDTRLANMSPDYSTRPTISIGTPIDVIVYEPDSTLLGSPELGYIAVMAYASTGTRRIPSFPCYTSDFYYDGEQVRAQVIETDRLEDGSYRYRFQLIDPVFPDTEYLFFIGREDKEVGGGIWDRYSKLTQDLSGYLINDPQFQYPGDYFFPYPCDLGELRTGTPDYTVGFPFYFRTAPASSNPPVPPDYDISASCVIRPRVFCQNTGVFTAIVSFPQGFDPSTITEIYADGAPAYKIIYDEDKHMTTGKFRRDEITEEPLDTVFEVEGRTGDNLKFHAYCSIDRIVTSGTCY